MVLKKDDLMTKIKTVIGDKTDDEALSLIEDVNDTYDSLSNKDGEDWQKKYEDEHKKYEDNDKMWREKYRDRFFNNSNENDEDDNNTTVEETVEEEKPLTFENLFKE